MRMLFQAYTIPLMIWTNPSLIGRRIWSSLREASLPVKYGWRWLILASPVIVTFWLTTSFAGQIPGDAGVVVVTAMAFAGWTLAVFVIGLIAGALLTWQKQEGEPPAFPLLQPGKADFRDVAASLEAEEDDREKDAGEEEAPIPGVKW